MTILASVPRSLLAGVAGLALVAGTAAAQPAAGAPQPLELGLDGGITVGLGDLEGTAIQFPAQNFRVGFFRSPTMSIEPYGALNYFTVGDADLTQISVGTGLLFHFSPDRTQSQTYLRPFVGLDFIGGDGDSETQFELGAGLGVKVPWQDRFAWRLEAAVGHAVETDAMPGGTSIRLLAGLSFFTR